MACSEKQANEANTVISRVEIFLVNVSCPINENALTDSGHLIT